MNILSKHWFFVVVAVLMLTANFYSHMFSTLPLKRFLDNEFPSESYVISRIAMNDHESLGYEGGFMLKIPESEALYMATDKEPYLDYGQKMADGKDDLIRYYSHIGFQDDLLYPVWGGLFKIRDHVRETARDGSRWQKRLTHYDTYYIVKITQLVVALLNAIVLAMILLWVAREFTLGTAYITLGLALVFMPDLTFFGRSMWWMMFTWFLPFLTLLYAYRWRGGQGLRAVPLILFSALAGTFLTLKTSMGYELTSTIMAASVIPATYYAISRGWSFKAWFGQCFVIGVFQLAGIALTLYLHYQALAGVGLDPIATLENRFQMRAYGGEAAAGFEGLIAESIDVNVFKVYFEYLFLPQDMGVPQIVLMFPLLLWLWNRRTSWKSGFTENATDRALLTGVGLGFLGALSILTILKGHAYVHNFDVVAFSIPMNLILCIFYAQKIKEKIACA